MRLIIKLCALINLFFFLALQAKADELKIFTWEDFFSESVIEDFESKYGHTVSLIFFESEMLRDAVVYSGKAAAYDLIIMDGLTLGELGEAGTLADMSSAIAKGDQIFTTNANKACSKYGVPYAHGTMGIGYRTSVVASPISTWMDVFVYALENPRTVVLPGDDLDTIAIALMALGYHPMSENESELKQAYQLLLKVKDKLLVLRTSIGYALDKKDKSEMEVAVMYSGETELIGEVTEQDDWVYTIPDEGTLLWHECLTTHINKPISNAAKEFLSHINETDNAVKNAEEIWFASSNINALGSASEEYLQDEELFPVNLTDANSHEYKSLSRDAENLRSQILSVIQNRK